MQLLEEFRWRGILTNASEGIEELFAGAGATGYIGFDPSAASLHVGSLLPVMALARFQRHGHRPIAVVGGGTGLIGDPSGKTEERKLLTREEIDSNLQGLRKQLRRFLDFEAKSNPALMVNNADWLVPMSLMSFLRDLGKHFTVNYMVSKESVKRRLEQEEGISFTEFSYMLLQAYDFLHLFDTYGCRLQMGGSDQWGNITAGMDLVGRVRKAQVHGLVFPLVTTVSGVKFGKTEAGTVWLDPELTSPYRFYQFWFNTDDRDVLGYLKFFTWLEKREVEELAQSLEGAPERREAQIRLAREVTKMVHGPTALEKAERASKALFGEEIRELTAEEIGEVFFDTPSGEIPRSKLLGGGMPLSDLLPQAGLAQSKSEARRLIESGGIYINNSRITDPKKSVAISDVLAGQFVILRRGAREFRVLRLLP